MPSDSKPSHEPMLTQIYVAIWRHLATKNNLLHAVSFWGNLNHCDRQCISKRMFLKLLYSFLETEIELQWLDIISCQCSGASNDHQGDVLTESQQAWIASTEKLELSYCQLFFISHTDCCCNDSRHHNWRQSWHSENSTENQELSWRQLSRHWWPRRLS